MNNDNKVFETAKNGGRHSGTYKQALEKTNAQLNKSIRSYNKKIKEHKNKIKNPKRYNSNWVKMDIREQTGLIKHWEKEIKNLTGESLILKIVKKERANNE